MMTMDYLRENSPGTFREFIRFLMEWELPPRSMFEKILVEILKVSPFEHKTH